MKKLIGTIFCVILLCGIMLFMASCFDDQTNGDDDQTNNGTTILGTDLSSKSMTLDGKALNIVLSNATTEFSFLEDITVSDDATYVVARDEYCENVIHTKKVPLNEGDNRFYILVTNGKDMALYTVNIRRKHMYTVSFNSNGGDAVPPQNVEEGALAVKPDDISRAGYDFCGWDYDFTKPITGDICVNLSWSLSAEMDNFIFTESDTGFFITGLKNNTVKDVVIPDYVTGMADDLFSYSETLTSIIIGDGITSISKAAFIDCGNLSYVSIGDSVTSIGECAFANCYALTTVVMGKSVTGIDVGAFYSCYRLKSITVPEGVTSIGEEAFEGCLSLWEVINNSKLDITAGSADHGNIGCYAMEVHTGEGKITDLDGYLFYTVDGTNYLLGYNKIDADTLTLPQSYNGQSYEIARYAFAGYYSLTSIVIPDSVTYIGEAAFIECEFLENITFGNGVKAIGDQAFMYCYSLTDVAIPHSVTVIGASAFYACGLKSLTIPDSVTVIKEGAFEYCDDFWTLTLGSGVTSIGDGAFFGCKKMIEVINYSNLDITVGSDDFGGIGCYAKEVHKGESNITEYEGFLFYSCNGANYLLGYNGTPDALTLPQSYMGQTYEVYYGAFNSVDSLVSVTIPDSVVSIGDLAFSGCYSLTDITIGEGVLSIGERAFSYCDALGNIIIPDSVVSIGESAFEGCFALTSIAIPDSVTFIGDWAFRGCCNLTDVTIGKGVTNIGIGAFDWCDSLMSVIFENASGWTVVEPEETSGTEISASALSDPYTAASYVKETYSYHKWVII